MSTSLVIVEWYVAILLLGLAGSIMLMKLGVGCVTAWAGGRVIGLLIVALTIWWAGWAGIESWIELGEAIAVTMVVLGAAQVFALRHGIRKILLVECFFLAGFLFVLVVRSSMPEILHTEKFMDLGIMTGLLKSDQLPPMDIWMSGRTLQYYYFGPLTWVVPVSISGISVEVAYNLIVATVGGLIFMLAWAIGLCIYGSRLSALLCVFFCGIAGTYDGLRQAFTGHGIEAVGIWDSTRIDPKVIMEFPLFSLWLGDLHSHLLVVPLSLLALLLGIHGFQKGFSIRLAFLTGLVLGGILATSPWSFPAFLGMVILMVVFAPGVRQPWARKAVLIAVLSAMPMIAALPLLMEYRPYVGGFNMVASGTGFPDFLSYAGFLLFPVLVIAIVFHFSSASRVDSSYLKLVVIAAMVTLTAAVSQRPTLVFTTSLIALLLVGAYNATQPMIRLVLGLSICGAFLLLIPELVYLVDGYESEYNRLNTVFKFYHQAWLVLCFAVPLAFQLQGRQSRIFRPVLLGLVLAACVHPLSLFARLDWDRRGLDGFRWMDPVDRKLVRFLSGRGGGEVMLEAVGDSYSQFGRLSSATGVVTYLGWPGHQILWRGAEVSTEIERRKWIVDKIYSSSRISEVRRLATTEKISLIAVGNLELSRYPVQALKRIKQSGEVIFSAGDGFVVKMH